MKENNKINNDKMVNLKIIFYIISIIILICFAVVLLVSIIEDSKKAEQTDETELAINYAEDMEIKAQRVPLEEEVYAMREKVLEGMSEEEITPAYLGEYAITEIAGKSRISGMSDEEAEKFIGGYLRVSPSQMFIIGDYVGSTDVSGYIENILSKDEFEEIFQVSAEDLVPGKEEIVQVSAEIMERSNINYSLSTFFILDKDTILLTQDGVFWKAIRNK